MKQAVVPKKVVTELLAEAGPRLVLVGGQALKVWVDRYDVRLPDEFAFVSRDVGFLAESAADSDAVRRLARVLRGTAVFPKRRAALTALVGQAVKELGDDEVFNVDVLHRVFGADENVRARAVEVRLTGVTFRVMHPLDVLKSRVDNLHGLAEKRNELGEAQLCAGIAMARAFLLDAAKAAVGERTRRPPTLRYVAFVERVARSDAGKKVAARHGIHVADAIEPDVIPTREFHERHLPRLIRLMSEARRAEIVRRR